MKDISFRNINKELLMSLFLDEAFIMFENGGWIISFNFRRK